MFEIYYLTFLGNVEDVYSQDDVKVETWKEIF